MGARQQLQGGPSRRGEAMMTKENQPRCHADRKRFDTDPQEGGEMAGEKMADGGWPVVDGKKS